MRAFSSSSDFFLRKPSVALMKSSINLPISMAMASSLIFVKREGYNYIIRYHFAFIGRIKHCFFLIYPGERLVCFRCRAIQFQNRNAITDLVEEKVTGIQGDFATFNLDIVLVADFAVLPVFFQGYFRYYSGGQVTCFQPVPSIN